MRGTLRDQVRYPSPPLAVSRATRGKKWSSSASLNTVKHMKHYDDDRVLDALDATEIGYLVQRGDGLDQMQVWLFEVLNHKDPSFLCIVTHIVHVL